jgi:hypothetical protein
MALLVPDDERLAVEELEGRRDQLLSEPARTQPVILFHLENDQDPIEQDRKGGGACGHAAFHCHVGLTLEHEPKVRVPLPAVAPADALDWLLSTVVPNWEPAPWTRIFGAQVAPQRA